MGQSVLDQEYYEFVKKNPDKKFVIYLRIHPEDNLEKNFVFELENDFGKCSYLTEKRLAIFIVFGKDIPGFLDVLNHSNFSLYISFVQSEEELFQSE
ncbi:MAG TPA: hypothetical protein PL089_14560 [Ignavibacteria bacterium]|nr:hypothetical protein [Ignavibacteria bacterium]